MTWVGTPYDSSLSRACLHKTNYIAAPLMAYKGDVPSPLDLRVGVRVDGQHHQLPTTSSVSRHASIAGWTTAQWSWYPGRPNVPQNIPQCPDKKRTLPSLIRINVAARRPHMSVDPELSVITTSSLSEHRSDMRWFCAGLDDSRRWHVRAWPTDCGFMERGSILESRYCMAAAWRYARLTAPN